MATGDVKIGERGLWRPEGGWLWADEGQTSLPNTRDADEAAAHVARYERDEFWCSGCKAWHPKPYVFRRFAGVYCAEAAERHKAANNRRCGLCGRPLWDCYC